MARQTRAVAPSLARPGLMHHASNSIGRHIKNRSIRHSRVIGWVRGLPCAGASQDRYGWREGCSPSRAACEEAPPKADYDQVTLEGAFTINVTHEAHA